MIFDTIENYKNYHTCEAKLAKGFAFIEKAVSEKFPIGKYEIDGTEIYAIIQEYTTKLPDEALFEGHKKYIDIQYVISGIEEIGIIDISKAEVEKEYNDESDAAFYAKNGKSGKLVLESGDFAVFCPNDLHMPGLAFERKTSDVKKIVVKVRV